MDWVAASVASPPQRNQRTGLTHDDQIVTREGERSLAMESREGTPPTRGDGRGRRRRRSVIAKPNGGRPDQALVAWER